MDNKGSLTSFYDELKNGPDTPVVPNPRLDTGPIGMAPATTAWRSQANRECETLKDACAKKILLNIYCRVIPLDSDYVDGNQGVMKGDIDNFLANKNMTATQYIKSGYEKTNAPLLEFILRSCNNIGKKFMQEADETLKDAAKNNLDVPPPVAEPDGEDVDNQLVEIEKDEEYGSFIDKLKQKTIDKIVADVSGIINKTSEEDNMTFNPNPVGGPGIGESTVSFVFNHINEKLWKENIELTPSHTEEILVLAIRESVLNMLDTTFKQPDSEFRPFSSKIRFGKGAVVTEAVIQNFVATNKT